MFNFFKSLFNNKEEKINSLLPTQKETVNINNIEWATRNEGTDKNNPTGKLYTGEQALLFENEEWRLPTPEDVTTLQKTNCSSETVSSICGIWLNNELFLPFNRDYFEPPAQNERPNLNIAALWINEDISTTHQYYTEFCYVYWINKSLPPYFFKRKTISPLNILCGVRLIKR